MATFPNAAPSTGGQGIIIDGDAAVARPVGALVYNTSGTPSVPTGLYRSTAATPATYELVTASGIFLSKQVTLSASPLVIALPGVLATDEVFVSFVSDDTGGALTKILGVATADTVTLTSVTALTNSDAVINFMVVR